MRALLGLGSNLGDREAHLAHALRRLADTMTVTGVSSVYRTEPVGHADQPDFLNMVARVETGMPPAELLATTRRIEHERGRRRAFRNAPRTLDIDILLIGSLVLETEELTVPHPRLMERDFVLVPLVEVEPGAMHPVSGQRLATVLEGREARGVVRVGSGEDLVRGGTD